MSSNLYIYRQGSKLEYKNKEIIISDKDHDFRVIGEEKVKKLGNIVIFGKTHISMETMQELLTDGIPITFLSQNGRYFGSLNSTSHVDINIQRLQFKKGEDKDFGFKLAKKFLEAKVKNQCHLLYLKSKQFENLIPRIHAVRIKNELDKIKDISDIKELIKIVDNTDKLYYSALCEILPEEYKFSERTKQPPLDPFNATISLGYSLLIYEFFSILESKGLNPYATFYDLERTYLPALCLDLMEEWRAPIVDSLAIQFFKTKNITIKDFNVEYETGAVSLNDRIAEIFIEMFEDKLKEKTSRLTEVSYKMSYRRTFEYQVVKLIDCLKADNPDLYTLFYYKE